MRPRPLAGDARPPGGAPIPVATGPRVVLGPMRNAGSTRRQIGEPCARIRRMARRKASLPVPMESICRGTPDTI